VSTDVLWLRPFKTVEVLRLALLEWKHRYNLCGSSSGMEFLTPEQALRQHEATHLPARMQSALCLKNRKRYSTAGFSSFGLARHPNGSEEPMSQDGYAQKLEQEVANYRDVANVHDLPAIFHYWSNKYLLPKLQALGVDGIEAFFATHVGRLAAAHPGELRLLSVGAGNCDTEVRIADLLVERGLTRFAIECLDVNPQMLQRGRATAGAAGHAARFTFLETDLNGWKPQARYHAILANQSLHHFVELEALFDKIAQALHPTGYFLTSDMIDRNGHQRWPEAMTHVARLWTLLEDRHRYNHLLKRLEPTYENWDCSKEGFEGIRAQDILPLLEKRFHFEWFLAFANLIDVFTDRTFGHNFDVDNPRDRAFIDYVAGLDEELIEAGILSPTHMVAAMTLRPRRGRPTLTYKHLTPSFCLHRTAAQDGEAPRARPAIERAIDVVRRAGLVQRVPRPVRVRLNRLLGR
jgi:SAM-dependent methyltransferase